MKKITLFTLLAVLAGSSMFAQFARVQAIHNSPDAAAATVDVYVNDELLFNNVPFRTSTEFIDAFAGIPLEVTVAPGDSTSSADGFYSTTATLTNGETYVIVASGIISDTGYTPNQPFDVAIYPGARETAMDPNNVDVLLFHGSTDTPTVDAVEPGVGLIVNDISYGEFFGYLMLPVEDYELEVLTSDGGMLLGSYMAPFQSLNLQGQAITVLASGFLDPSVNSNGPEFGLFAALPTGGNLIPLPEATAGTEKFSAKKISVHPNPAKDVVTITIPFAHTALSGKLYDMAGREVRSFKGTSINVSGLENGIYVLSGDADGKSFQQKIVVKN